MSASLCASVACILILTWLPMQSFVESGFFQEGRFYLNYVGTQCDSRTNSDEAFSVALDLLAWRVLMRIILVLEPSG